MGDSEAALAEHARLRALIISADVGESHTAMARALACGLEARDDVGAVTVLTDFEVLGPVLAQVLPSGFEFHLGRVKWSYDLAYRLFTRVGAARRFGEGALYALGGSALAATIERHRPDVVVSTYPVMNPVLGRLRVAGRLACPVATVVGPLGGLGFWTHPGLDLHMLQYPEAVPAVERLAGTGTARPVRPLVREEFLDAPTHDAARAQLGIAAGAKVVLISGGGWGAGDLAGATDACLELPAVEVIAVTGRNEPARAALADRYASEPRVRVLGFTEQMRELLGAADAFVSATAGLSCIEARLCGCPTICYGFAFGHVRDNTRALAGAGLARIARTPRELAGEVRGALAAGRRPSRTLQGLPTAAELTVALARAGAPSSGRDPVAAGATARLQRPRDHAVSDVTTMSTPHRPADDASDPHNIVLIDPMDLVTKLGGLD